MEHQISWWLIITCLGWASFWMTLMFLLIRKFDKVTIPQISDNVETPDHDDSLSRYGDWDDDMPY